MTAVVVTCGPSPYLARTLTSLAAQSQPAARVLVVDAARSPQSPALSDVIAAIGDTARTTAAMIAIEAPGARTFGAAVRMALAEQGAETRWLWLLHDDSAPEPTALAELLRAVDLAPSVGVAGPKQRTWDEPERLLEVGVTTSRFGRRMTGVEDGEVDQGQHDGREDVLGVGTAGMLVRTDVWEALGGTDPGLGPFGDGLDLSRRARLAGHRVVVVPAAVVRHAQASYLATREGAEADQRRSFVARRRAFLHAQLAGAPVLLLPAVAVLAVLSGIVRSLIQLTAKEPALALGELTAPLRTLAAPGRVLRARASARRSRRLRRRVLRPLETTWRDVAGEYRDRRLSRMEARRTVRAPSELELRELADLTRTRRLALGSLAVALIAVTAAAFSQTIVAVLHGSRLAGGALAPGAVLAGWWDAATSGWVAGGLGSPGPADPLLLVLYPLAALTDGAPGDLVLLGALVLSGLGAWFAAGAASRSVLLRWWAALVWAAAPPVLLGVGQGRLGAVLAHVMVPWIALGIARALGYNRVDVIASGLVGAQRDPADREPAPDLAVGDVPTDGARDASRGSIGAAAGAGLALAIASAGAPVLLLAGIVVLIVVAVGAPRRRARLVLVALPALALHGPVVAAALTGPAGSWRALLGDPGLPLASTGAPAWQQGLGWPVSPSTSALSLPAAVGAAWPYLVGGTLVLVALLALLRGAGVARGVRIGWWTAACGLAAAVVSARVEVGVGETVVVRGWSGPGVSLVLAGLLVAGLLGADGIRERLAHHTFGWRQPLIGLLTVLAILGPVAQLGAWAVQTREAEPSLAGRVQVLPLDHVLVPAIARQSQEAPGFSRILAIEPVGDSATAVRSALLRNDGPAMTHRSVMTDVRRLAGTDGATLVEPDEAQAALDGVVARLASGAAGDVSAALAEHAVAAILVPVAPVGASTAEVSARARLEGTLDATAGLERVTTNEAGTIWRVAVGASGTTAWARVLSPGAAPIALAAQDLRVEAEVAAGPAGRTVVLSERASSGWHARLDGHALRSVTGDWRASFELPATGGHLVIDYSPAERLPRLAIQGFVLLVTVLLAIPVRRRRAVR